MQGLGVINMLCEQSVTRHRAWLFPLLVTWVAFQRTDTHLRVGSLLLLPIIIIIIHVLQVRKQAE